MRKHGLVMLWTPKKRGWFRRVHYVCGCGTVGKATRGYVGEGDLRWKARRNHAQHAKRMERAA